MTNTQQIKQALANLFSAKMRSFLAMLGILVGTASVVALVSSGELATQKALAQFKNLGTDLLSLSLYEARPSSTQTPENTFTLKEAAEMQQQIPELKEIAPYTTVYIPISFSGHKLNGSVIGATESLASVINIKMEHGRFISYLDNISYYCVIGHKLYQQIQRVYSESPIGKQIRLGNNIFTIIGVAEPWAESSFFHENVNRAVIVPVQTAGILTRYAKINNIIMRLTPEANIEQVENQINQYLATHVSALKNFPTSAKQLIKSMTNQHQIFTLMLGMIGGIALLVGGIGVMNVMLVSVAERRREIGIRMAIGARRKDIRVLFLFEAITLALLGGTIGVIVGMLLSIIIGYFAGWGFGLFILPPVVGFSVSVATGVFFGYYPAYRASRLDPIETLRYE